MIRILASSDSPLFYLEKDGDQVLLREDNDTGVQGAIKRLGRQLFYHCDYNLIDVANWAAQKLPPSDYTVTLSPEVLGEEPKISEIYRKLSGLNKQDWNEVVEFGKKIDQMQKSVAGKTALEITNQLTDLYTNANALRTKVNYDESFKNKLIVFSQVCPDKKYAYYVKNALTSSEEMRQIIPSGVIY